MPRGLPLVRRESSVELRGLLRPTDPNARRRIRRVRGGGRESALDGVPIAWKDLDNAADLLAEFACDVGSVEDFVP